MSNAYEVYVELDCRPLTPRKYGGICDFGHRRRPGDPMIHAGIDECLDAQGRFFEVVLHGVSRVSDDRCVVAKFKTLEELRAGLPAVAILWVVNYVIRPMRNGSQESTPCPN